MPEKIDNKAQETKITDLLERDGTLQTKQNLDNVKPYTLRKLSAKDISPMIKIVKKMDISRLKTVFNDLDLNDISNLTNANKVTDEEIVGNEELNEEKSEIQINNSELMAKIGSSLIFEAIPMILDALDNCIGDVNKLLANVANMKVTELENLDLDIYFNLIYDFINKEEFAGFMRVVSRFLNSEK